MAEPATHPDPAARAGRAPASPKQLEADGHDDERLPGDVRLVVRDVRGARDHRLAVLPADSDLPDVVAIRHPTSARLELVADPHRPHEPELDRRAMERAGAERPRDVDDDQEADGLRAPGRDGQ